MATTQEYALLSLYVYKAKEDKNRPNLPSGWTRLEYQPDNSLGLSYGVFKRDATGEIVLAFSGTNNNAGDFQSDLAGPIGLPAWQISNAALAYQQTKEKYGSNITLSGHSLGGGLASVMATWFNRPAVVFDQAPFQLTAANPVMLAFVRAQLLLLGYNDAAMDSAISDFAAREGQVASLHVQGEFLQVIRSDLNTVAGNSTQINVNGNRASGIQLHSQALLTAALMSESFRAATFATSSVVPLVLDESLYAFDTATSRERNFLTDLVRSEQSSAVGAGKLSHFAADLQALGANSSGLSVAAQDALIAQTIEWYYWQGTNYGGQQSFAVSSGNTLQYTTARGAALPGNQNRASSYVDKWLGPIANDHGEFYFPSFGTAYQQWNVATGTGNAIANAIDAGKTQLFIGQGGNDDYQGGAADDLFFAGSGNDALRGGQGDDRLYGGAGNDSLEGGSGSDNLQGGADLDTYTFAGAFGADTVLDSDYSGAVVVAGLSTLNGSGAVKTSASTWETHGGQVKYTRIDGAAGKADLEITVASVGATGSILLRDWVDGRLGINLGSTLVAAPYSQVLVGDYIKKGSNGLYSYTHWVYDLGGEGDGWVFDNDGNGYHYTNNIGSDGYSANAPDWLVGDYSNDKIQGLGGNDLLSGWEGNDQISGGEGSDLLYGHLGHDILDGGPGNDFIWGSGFGGDWSYMQLAVDTHPLPETLPGTFLAGGFYWAITSEVAWNVETGNVAESDSNISNGGDGDDFIAAGWVADVAHGDAGNDEIWGMGGADLLFGDADNDKLFGDGDVSDTTWHWTSDANHGNDVLDGGSGNDQIVGQGGDDLLFGGIGNDLLYGDDDRAGRTSVALHGKDSLEGGEGDDQLVGGGSSDALYGGAGNDILFGDSGNAPDGSAGYIAPQDQGGDYLDGGDGNDTLQGEGGNDELLGGAGLDLLFGDAGNDLLDGGADNDQLSGDDGDDSLAGGLGDDTLVGGLGSDLLDGGAGKDVLSGGDGIDTLIGGDGDDSLVGGLGADVMMGGGGADAYEVDDPGDVILESTDSYSELTSIASSITYTLPDAFGYLTLTGLTNIDGTGNALGNSMSGNSGNNVLTGLGGADRINGRAGNDTLLGGDGDDNLQGGLGDDLIEGGAGDDRLFGYAGWADDAPEVLDDDGADALDGGSGNDDLFGGRGSDVYLYGLGDGADTIGESEGDVAASIDELRFKAGISPEQVSLFKVGSSLMVVIEGGGAQIQISNYFGSASGASVEQIRFDDGTVWNAAVIGALVNVGTQSGSIGSTGDDIFVVDDEYDTITESAGDGVDTVNASRSYTLPLNVENLTLQGPMNLYGIGNSLNNILRGNDGNNSLDGKGGVGNSPYGTDLGWDVAYGGKGDDRYTNVETVVELPNEGTDTFVSIYSASLPANVENFDLSDGIGSHFAFPVTATGNELDNTLWSSGLGAMGDTLDGGLGADTMIARGWDSVTFVVDNIGDTVVPSPSGGVSDAVKSSIDYGLGAYLENLTLTGSSSLIGIGNELDNKVTGNSGANVLLGLDGNDTLDGGAGDDTLVGGAGSDIYAYNALTSTSRGNDVIDNFDTSAGRNDMIVFGTTANNMEIIRRGDDLAIRWTDSWSNVSSVSIKLFYAAENASDHRIDKVRFSDGTIWTSDQLAAVADANALPNVITGTEQADSSLTGTWRYDVISGLGGDDTIILSGGGDTAIPGAGADSVYGSTSTNPDTVIFGRSDGQDYFFRAEAQDTIRWLPGVLPSDVIVRFVPVPASSRTDLVLTVAGTTDRLTLTPPDGMSVSGGARVEFADSTDVWTPADLIGRSLLSTENADQIYGTATADSISGGGGADSLYGLEGNDTLDGGDGDDTLDGGTGADVMVGGVGNDTYVVDEVGDTVAEMPGSGNDSVTASITFALSADFENLTLSGAAAINGTGNGANNAIAGNSADNILDGGAGNDTLSGGAGNDIYVVDSTLDVVTEAANAGTDLIQAGVTWVLPVNVENLTLTGATAINATGNASANVLRGNAGDNVINGAAGADAMFGGAGNDTFVVDAAADTVTELAGEGLDVVQSAVAFTLGANIENLTLSGTSAIAGTGNSLDNQITGNSGNNTLTGGAGNDRVVGGGGTDTLVGGAGDDTMVVDGATDVVTELAGEGQDTVESTATFTLPVNVENLKLTGTAAINGTGNTGNNVLTGNDAANTLNGGAGSDVLDGGAGNDIYVVDVATDSVVELASAGTDLVQSAVSWILGNDLENLTLTGTAVLNGTGNGLNNLLTGNSAANVLDGKEGADSLVGGAGNDTYVVDNASDVVTEAASSGTDTVQSSVTWTLATNIENLTLTGTSAIDGTGNTLVNQLLGNLANNTLNGGAGADTLVGGQGNDIYIVDSAGDVVTELLAEGTDTIQSAVTYTLPNNVEGLTLTGTSAINGTGNAQDNYVTGNAGANVLTGGQGNDVLGGGSGNDTYVVDAIGDVVVEALSAGTDLVQSTISWTLGDNVEQLTLTGGAAVNGTGNTLNNTLTGNAADNVLDGGDGSDTMIGGAGNDTYAVNATTDVVTEAASAGTDTVLASVTLTLAANVENMTLTGTGAINGTGNALANALTGNVANNTLTGGEGNDTYDGATGNDTLVDASVTSADIYRWGLNLGSDVISDAGGADSIELGTGIAGSQLTYTHNGNDLRIGLVGQSDTLTVQGWYTSSSKRVEVLKLADGSTINLGTAAPLSAAVPPLTFAWPPGLQGRDTSYIGERHLLVPREQFGFDGTGTCGDTTLNTLIEAMAAFAPQAAGTVANMAWWHRGHTDLVAADAR